MTPAQGVASREFARIAPSTALSADDDIDLICITVYMTAYVEYRWKIDICSRASLLENGGVCQRQVRG
jgi:hypothetical protein